MNISDYKNKLSKSEGKLDLLNSQLSREQDNLENLFVYQKDLEQAQSFLQAVAQQTQSQLRYHIKDIVQLSIDTVFPDECEFDIEFEIKRGKTEAKLVFREKGEEIDPLDASAGGFVDLASLGLRIAAWTLGNTRPVIILDEPFTHLSKDLSGLGADVIKDLSKELGLQFIIVTHGGEIINVADKVFEVSRMDEDGYKVSKIKEIE